MSSLSKLRSYYLRIIVIWVAAAILVIQANTVAPGIPHIIVVRPNPYPPHVCETVPDLNPNSPTYGNPICAKR